MDMSEGEPSEPSASDEVETLIPASSLGSDTEIRYVGLESDEDDSVVVPSPTTGGRSMDSVVEDANCPRVSLGMTDVRECEDGRRRKSPHPLEEAGLVGLRNIGNTCFMNSILQCLSNTESLLRVILSNHTCETNPNSPMKGELFQAFVRLMECIWDKTKPSSPLDTTNLKGEIEKLCPTFRGAQQHDAQELLRILLEGLHNDINRVIQKPTLSMDVPSQELSDQEKSQLAWDWILQYENSPITDIFVGQLESTLTCLNCGNRSLTFDPFWDLSVSIPSSGVKGAPVSLKECLELFTQEETLEGNEKPYCEKCKAHKPATKRFTIQKFPDVLVIHLKRFSRDDRGKLRTVVEFPLDNLDVGIYADVPVNNCAYNLFAISTHYGTAYSGHYVAYAKHPYSKEWHKYDDTRVSECEPEDAASAEAYVLFYELSLASKCLMDR